MDINSNELLTQRCCSIIFNLYAICNRCNGKTILSDANDVYCNYKLLSEYYVRLASRLIFNRLVTRKLSMTKMNICINDYISFSFSPFSVRFELDFGKLLGKIETRVK